MITYDQLETIVLHLLECERKPEIKYKEQKTDKGPGRGKKVPYTPSKFIEVLFCSGLEDNRICSMEICVHEDKLPESLNKLKRAYDFIAGGKDLFSFRFGQGREIRINGSSVFARILLVEDKE